MAGGIDVKGLSVSVATTASVRISRWGLLQMPQCVRQLLKGNNSLHTPELKWARPLGLNSRRNVKIYHIFRSANPSFATAVNIGTSTTTSFIDMNAPRGTTQYYFVVAQNSAGMGVPCSGIEVLIPN